MNQKINAKPHTGNTLGLVTYANKIIKAVKILSDNERS